jgi:hypothetical protein
LEDRVCAMRPGHVRGHEVHRGGHLLVGAVGEGAAFGGCVILTIGGRWYILRVILQNTIRGRLNVEKFAAPFDYQLRVSRDGVETRVTVDLMETANLLLGLTVQARRAYEDQDRTSRAVFGTAREQCVVVIWRDTGGLDLGAEAAFVQEKILRLPKSSETLEVWKPDWVNVNGDSLIPTALPIEAVFIEAMRQPIALAGGN